MFKHDKVLLKYIKVENPNPQYASINARVIGWRKWRIKSSYEISVSKFQNKR